VARCFKNYFTKLLEKMNKINKHFRFRYFISFLRIIMIFLFLWKKVKFKSLQVYIGRHVRFDIEQIPLILKRKCYLSDRTDICCIGRGKVSIGEATYIGPILELYPWRKYPLERIV